MEKAFIFLAKHKDVAFATIEGDRPKIRVFQIMKRENNTLYFATAPHKEVYRQLQLCPFVELLAMAGNISVRVKGKAVFDVSDKTRKEIYETELPHRAVAVYLYLETRADRERTCYPAIGTIARELHLSVSTVKRAIHDLECAGFIQKKQRWRENGGKSSLLYEIIK